jgi:hypothetical protein
MWFERFVMYALAILGAITLVGIVCRLLGYNWLFVPIKDLW